MAFIRLIKRNKPATYNVHVVYRINPTLRKGAFRFTKKGVDFLHANFPQLQLNKPFRVFLDRDNGNLAFLSDEKGEFNISSSKKDQYAIFNRAITKEIDKDSYYFIQPSKEYSFILVSVEDPKTSKLPVPKLEPIQAVISADIHRVVKKLNKQPSFDEYLQHSDYTLFDLQKAFKKDWDAILTLLGYRVATKTYSYHEVAEEIKKVAKSLGKLPTIEEYQQKAKVDVNIAISVSKSTTWIELLEKVFRASKDLVEAVLNTNHPYYQQQLSKLKAISNKLRRVPTIEEAVKYGINVDLLGKRLNKSWVELLELSGIKLNKKAKASINQTKRVVKKEEMLEDVNRIAKELGYYPDTLKYNLFGAYSANNIMYGFNVSDWVAVIDLAKSREVLPPNILNIKNKASIDKTILEYLIFGQTKSRLSV